MSKYKVKTIKMSRFVAAFTIALVSFFAGALTIFTYFKSEFQSSFGKNSDELQVISTRMYPNYGFLNANLSDFSETVIFYVELRNFGNKEIIITSAEYEISDSKILDFATHGQGKNSLGELPEKNNFIKIYPGESKFIRLAKGIKLKGITEFFDNQEYRSEFYSKYGNAYLLHDQSWIDTFNSELASRYGKDSTLTISFYEKYKKLIKKYQIRLSDGADIFDHSGKLQHDTFLGTILSLYNNEEYIVNPY